MILERVAQFADTLYQRAERTDQSGKFDDQIWDSLKESGLAVAAFPEAAGGAGLCQPSQHAYLFEVLRLLGASDLSMARLVEGHINAILLVCRYGTASQVEELAKSARAGELSGVWGADDEKGLHIVTDISRPRLKGRKILASGAGIVTRPLVTAAGVHGQALCLLRLDPSHPVDLSGWRAQGMRSTATGSVDLTDMQLSAENFVGAPGDFMKQPHFSGGAWRFCAAHLGAAERLVDLFREHLKVRKRTNDPYQLQRVALCSIAVRTSRFWIEETARRLAGDVQDCAEVVALANLTRSVTERAALEVMENVQRGVGLASFIFPNPIERISRDLSTYLRQPVPDLAMSDGGRTVLESDRPIGEFC